MNSSFSVQTDQQVTITVESSILYALWLSSCGREGGRVRFEVRTALVGEGAPIQVTGYTENGKKLGKVKGEVRMNRFEGAFDVPERLKPGDQLYFEAKLTKHGLSMESNSIPAKPAILVRSMKWDRSEARRGDIVRIQAQFEDLGERTDAAVIVYEYDPDGNHDKIASIPVEIADDKLDIEWEYGYHEDVNQIPTETEMQKHGRHYIPPEYFFVVLIGDEKIGKEQESGLLKFREELAVEWADADGNPAENRELLLKKPDGGEEKIKTGSDGTIELDNLEPGPTGIETAGNDNGKH